MRKHLFALAVFASLLPFATARAQPLVQSQEGIALQNQILQLQQQMQQIQAGGGGGSSLGGSVPAPAYSGGTAPPDSSVVTNLLNQVGQLQTQVQQLSGQVDTLQNQVNTQHDATEKEIGDLNFKITGGATPGAPAAPGAPVPASAPSSAPAAPPAPAVASTDLAGSLKAARTALANHQYTSAQTLAQGIISKGPRTPQAYSAHYILAESLYNQGKTQSAAIAYDDAYNANRNGVNAPASLLGLANSLTAIHQEAAACDTLASLNSQFPTPPAGLATSISAASHRAHCT